MQKPEPNQKLKLWWRHAAMRFKTLWHVEKISRLQHQSSKRLGAG
jgi:hypothetical protein